MPTIAVNLPDEQAGAVRAAVEAGAYASTDALMEDALKLWAQHRFLPHGDPERLKQAYDEGKASGPGRVIDFGELRRDMKERALPRG